MNIYLALFLGSLFGFVLHRVGATNPQNIINMLRLNDFHLMKVILFAVSLSTALLFLGLELGLIDSTHLSVKSSYWGVILGGALLGIGWAIGGYCPGTGVAAIGEGRKDAMVFVVGGLFGALVYMLSYSSIMDTVLMDKIFGGKSMLAVVSDVPFQGLIDFVPGILVAFVVAALTGFLALKLPSRKGQA